MPAPQPAAGGGTRTKARWLLAAAMAWLLTLLFLTFPGINTNPRATFGDQIRGDAARPFCYRPLVPWTVRALTAPIPQGVQSRLEMALKWMPAIDTQRLAQEDLPYVPAFVGITFLCFLATLHALRLLARDLSLATGPLLDLLPPLSALLLPLLFRYQNYVYDPATLALSTAALALLVTGRTAAYYAAFVAACLNKETAILLTAAYWLWNRKRKSTVHLSAHIAAQIALAAAVRALLVTSFSGNPGSALEFHLLDHNALLYQRHLTLAYVAIVAAVTSLVVTYRWRDKPAFLRHGLLLLFPPLLVATLFFGYIDELRDYYEVFPFLALLALDSMSRIWGAPGRAAQADLGPSWPSTTASR